MAFPTFRSKTEAGVTAPSTAVSIGAPAGVVSGDYQIVVLSMSSGSVTVGTTPSGWTLLSNDQVTSSTTPDRGGTQRIAVYESSTATGTFSMTLGGSARIWAGVRLAYQQPAGASTARTLAIVKTIDATGTSGTTKALPSITNSTSFDAFAIGICVSDNLDHAWTSTGTYTQRSLYHQGSASEHQGFAIGDTQVSTGASSSATFTVDLADEVARYQILLNGTVGAFAPIVDAGVDAVIDQFETFTRTATVNNGGSAITSQSWTVVSGPNPDETGDVVSTTDTINWAPTIGGGTYVLRYSATNIAGTDIDDVNVTVNFLDFPLTANLVLAASTSGRARTGGQSPSANLPLLANRVGVKAVSSSRTANIKLATSVVVQKVSVVTANIKLHAVLTNVSRPGAALVTAPLRLIAASTASRVTTGVVVTANVALLASSVTTGLHSRAVSATPLRLTATRIGSKTAIKNVNLNVKLLASVGNIMHAGITDDIGYLILSASVSGRFRTNPDVPVGFNLSLLATPETSSAHNNQDVDANLTLHFTVFVQRIISEIASAILPRADNTTKYELVCVARIPQTSGAPAFLIIDPIDWTGITHTEELSAASTLSTTAKISNLTEPVLQRLRKMAELPSEMWLYRNGKQVFSGPLLGWNVNGESLTLQSQDLMAYTRMMYITQDLKYTNIEQFDIVAGLINQWQDLDYGNFGIDTTGIAASGIPRTITYAYKELHNVAQRIDDLTKMTDGFDIGIDPASRKLELYHPYRGVDRSTGEDAIVFDSRNVTSTDIVSSAAPGDLASEGLGTGTASGADVPFVSSASNLELRARYGRTGFTGTFDQVTDQASLESYVQAMIDARGATLMIPGPNARVTVDSDVSAYDVGDTVDYQLHSELSVSGAFRIRKRVITVADTGTESVSVEFV